MGKTARTNRAAILDYAGFALVLAGLNAWLATGDPLWLNANPNPWLLLPVYLGCRYGFAAGALSGIVTASVVAAYLVGTGAGPAQEVLLDQRLPLLGFVIGGILTGTVRSLLNKRLQELESTAHTLGQENARLRADNSLLDETRHQLQQRLALFGAETCSLDNQLRALFAPSAGPVLPGCLAILRSAAEVRGSCVVELQDDRSAKVLAALDSHYNTGDTIAAPQLALAHEATRAGQVITWNANEEQPGTDFLAAVPWGASAKKVVVLIEDMSFTALRRDVFVRIETIVRWIARFLPDPVSDAQTAPAASEVPIVQNAILTAAEFESHGNLARETFQSLRLPSTIAEFEDSAPGDRNNGEGSVLEILTGALQEHVQPPRVASVAAESGKLRVLLPMEGPRDAELFTRAVLEPLEAAGRVQPGRIRHRFIEIGENGSGNNASNGSP